jgi:predicted secreted Zn-dependent protease
MISKERLLAPLFASHLPHYPVVTVVKRLVVEVFVLAAFAFAALTSIAQAAPAQPPEVPTVSSQPPAQIPPSTPAGSTETPSVSVQATVRPPKSPACTKGSLPSPAPLTLNPQQPGVTRIVETPLYYTVHGASLADVKTQISQCSPVENGRYAAVTVSTINWQFSYTIDATTGLCKISTVSIGVHTGFLYPNWSSPNPQWERFMSKLKLHEQGHAELDAATANAILRDLQAMPAASCDTIAANANELANTHIANLRQANHNYDSSTGHGASQGAHL